MAKNLVIVESPAKAKTISKILGTGYDVQASMGHIYDLPKSKMGVDPTKDFKTTYIVLPDKKKIVSFLKSRIDKDTDLWIATDEDREGEAIGYNFLQALKIPKSIAAKVKRIVFHEITKSAILKAIKNPRKIDQNLVEAQHARRVLDRLVGYELSPLLWRKIHYGLSAGRVQSVAVRLIVDREREIEAFKPEEYWTIEGEFMSKVKSEEAFKALLVKKDDKKIDLRSSKDAKKVLKDLNKAFYFVSKVEQKEVKKSPSPPFITSTLQQEASRKLGFSVKKTMMIAQQLYEGIDIGKGEVGLITYMRTDSVNLASSALKEAQGVIREQFGDRFVLDTPRRFRSRKGAQEAHEAIRPVKVSRLPQDIQKYLNKDQYRLYDLVWKRMIASQMKEAVLDKVTVEVSTKDKNKYIFKAQGETVKFPGFTRVYTESLNGGKLENLKLPKLEEGEDVDLKSIESKQHFTEPPPRYSEAALVKKLEAEGIGRPSTYAPTISTIIARNYVEKEGRVLKPTDTGKVVTDVLVEHFSNIVDLKFTANMEDDLDKIADGEKKWVPIVREFYGPFHGLIENKEKTLKKSDIVNEKSDEICDQCGKKMVIKLGKYGKFLSCSDYPKCKNAKPLGENGEDKEFLALQKKFNGKRCEKCDGEMEVKKGKFGPFLGCKSYPKCKNIKPIIKFTGVKCPKCGGQLVERRTRKGGRLFYGCGKFPKCKFATWDKPLKTPCKKCGGLMVEKKEKKVCTGCQTPKSK